MKIGEICQNRIKLVKIGHSDIKSETGSKTEKKHWFEDARQLKHIKR